MKFLICYRFFVCRQVRESTAELISFKINSKMDESIESDCDEEIARISSEATNSPSLRGGRLHNSNGDAIAMDVGEREKTQDQTGRHDVPRPMSWDGGLSDNEEDVS